MMREFKSSYSGVNGALAGPVAGASFDDHSHSDLRREVGMVRKYVVMHGGLGRLAGAYASTVHNTPAPAKPPLCQHG